MVHTGLSRGLIFGFEIRLWSYAAADITISMWHVGHVQEGRERVEHGRVDARPASERKINNALKLEPDMFQKLHWERFVRLYLPDKKYYKHHFKNALHEPQRSERCRRPPDFEGVPVALREASCIAFFKLLFSVDN